MMLDNIERESLKKKMLDRWENEGGRIAADPVIANQSNLASQRDWNDHPGAGSWANYSIHGGQGGRGSGTSDGSVMI